MVSSDERNARLCRTIHTGVECHVFVRRESGAGEYLIVTNANSPCYYRLKSVR